MNIMPILIDWHPDMYEGIENRYRLTINDVLYDFANIELNLFNPTLDQPLQFSVDTEDASVKFQINIGTNTATKEAFYEVAQLTNVNCTIQYGSKNENLLQFFQNNIPTIWFADDSQLFGNLYIKQKNKPDVISQDNIIGIDWVGVNIEKESQDIAPYIQDSIQHYFIEKIKDSFQIVYDDDGCGEIADIIGINNSEEIIDVHLFHLKYALEGEVSNNIDNFYQVCGQAQKALKWGLMDKSNDIFKRFCSSGQK